jgi:hypothetical protein
MAINPNLFTGLGPFAGLTQAATESLSKGVGQLFGIKDPELEAQRAIAMAAQNPNDPTTLSNAANILAQAGKIDQAMALAGQARQITRQDQQFSLQQEQLELSKRSAKRADESALQTEIKNSPYSAIGKILSLPEGKEREALLTQVSNNISESNLSTATKQQQLENLKTQAALTEGYEPSLYKDSNNNPLFTKKGKIGYYYFDEEDGKIKQYKAKTGITTIKPPTALNPLDAAIAARMSGSTQPKTGATQQPPLAVTGQPQSQEVFPGVTKDALLAEQQRRKEARGK